MAALHYCYSKGLGVEKDPAAAFRVAQDAYQSGRPEGMHVLGRALMSGVGVVKNEEAGLKLIEEAAGQGFPLSQFTMGDRKMRARDPAGAIELWTKASDAGVDMARTFLGMMQDGSVPGVPRDVDAAIRLLTPAAERDFARAQGFLYQIYAADPEKKDLAAAKKWLLRAAENGFADAQTRLAWEYYQTRTNQRMFDFPKDVDAARKWAELASDQGSASAHMLFADLYEFGSDAVQPDFDKAVAYARKAADQNFPLAFGRLCRWNFEGKLLPRNMTEAIRMAERGAALNDGESHSYLAAFYLEHHIPQERLLPKDYARGQPIYSHHAIHHYVQGALNGNPFSLEQLKGKFVREARSRPDGVVWSFFVRDYPEDAKAFERLTGEKAR
jgi:TPR repeat protein